MQDITTFKDLYPIIYAIAKPAYIQKAKEIAPYIILLIVIFLIGWKIEKWQKKLRDKNNKREP